MKQTRKRGGARILCPKCKSPTRALDTRHMHTINAVRRRRRCERKHCNVIVTTVEQLEKS